METVQEENEQENKVEEIHVSAAEKAKKQGKELLLASSINDTAACLKLIDEGADINYEDSRSWVSTRLFHILII